MRRNANIRTRARKCSLFLLPVTMLFLAADLAVPGWGKFPNPVFYAQAFYAQAAQSTAKTWAKEWANNNATGSTQKRFRRYSHTDLAHYRLTLCEGDSVANNAGEAEALPLLSAQQAALRDTLTGNSSVVAVQQLGTPVCQLANGSWRWLLDTGLSLDVQVADDGTINHADLTR